VDLGSKCHQNGLREQETDKLRIKPQDAAEESHPERFITAKLRGGKIPVVRSTAAARQNLSVKNYAKVQLDDQRIDIDVADSPMGGPK